MCVFTSKTRLSTNHLKKNCESISFFNIRIIFRRFNYIELQKYQNDKTQ